MANRVCLGQKAAGQFGLWVSKPGLNVLTASESQMLFSSNVKTLQIAQNGKVTITALPYTLTIADLGFRPFFEAFVSGWNWVCAEVLSNTQIRFEQFDSASPQENGQPKYIIYTIFASVL